MKSKRIEVNIKGNIFAFNGNMCSKMCKNFATCPKCFKRSNAEHRNIMNYCENFRTKKSTASGNGGEEE